MRACFEAALSVSRFAGLVGFKLTPMDLVLPQLAAGLVQGLEARDTGPMRHVHGREDIVGRERNDRHLFGGQLQIIETGFPVARELSQTPSMPRSGSICQKFSITF